MSKVTKVGILAKVEAQGFKCALTGRDLKPETASLDHIRPLGRGGENTLENAWVLHREVNQAKDAFDGGVRWPLPRGRGARGSNGRQQH